MSITKEQLDIFNTYLRGIYPEWIDDGERIAFAIEFDVHMFNRLDFFPDGIISNFSWVEYNDALFELPSSNDEPNNSWFWLVPEKDITSYTEYIGEVELEDSAQRSMPLPSPLWKNFIEYIKEKLPFALFLLTNVERGHSTSEYFNLDFGNAYEEGDLWDFSLEDFESGAVEPDPEMIYWEIDGRLYETPFKVSK